MVKTSSCNSSLPSPSPDIMAAAEAQQKRQNLVAEKEAATVNKPKKTGSLALFARKVRGYTRLQLKVRISVFEINIVYEFFI